MTTKKTLNAPSNDEPYTINGRLNFCSFEIVPSDAKADEKLEVARKSLPYQSAYFKEIFSDELWQAMEHRKLSQSEFAENAGVQKQFLTKVFRGGNCTMDTIVKLAHSLNFTAHIHLTPNDVGCEWIHKLAWDLPRPLDNYSTFLSGAKYSNVSKIKKEMNCAIVTSDS